MNMINDIELEKNASSSLSLAEVIILYREGYVSLGKASKLSGLTMADFIQHLGHLGIEIVSVDETTEHEFSDLSAWRS